MGIDIEKKSFFGRLKDGLKKTKDGMVGSIEDVIFQRPKIDEDMLEELEETLILSDIGMDTTMKIISRLRDDIKNEKLDTPEKVLAQLKKIIAGILEGEADHALTQDLPLVILMVGVNGTGKTTSMAKIAHRLQQDGKSVLFAAADTFRAAAAEQLEIWGDRLGVPVIRHAEGADPSAVIFDAAGAAKARGVDVLICDTAGRLQNKRNLMNELEKMNKVIDREFPDAARETLLVLDAGTGKNAVSQAELFNEAAKITGIVLTKLDGTAKGGIVITLADQFGFPVKFIGVGEGMEDLQEFDPQAFTDALFGDEWAGTEEPEEENPSEDPDKAEDPEAAHDSDAPETPDAAEEAASADETAEPETAGETEVSEAADVPDTADPAEASENSEEPEKPDARDNIEEPDSPESADNSEEPDAADAAEAPEAAEEAAEPESSEETAESETAGGPDAPEGPETAEESDNPDTSQVVGWFRRRFRKD